MPVSLRGLPLQGFQQAAAPSGSGGEVMLSEEAEKVQEVQPRLICVVASDSLRSVWVRKNC